jgi:hypothetical protein
VDGTRETLVRRLKDKLENAGLWVSTKEFRLNESILAGSILRRIS